MYFSKHTSTMKNVSMLVVLVIALIGIAVTCPPPTLPTGATWISDVNCTHGQNYQTLSPPRQKCHCWGHCGYICQSTGSTASTTATTTKTTTTTPTTTASTTTTTTPTTTTTAASTTTASTTSTTTKATTSTSTTAKTSPCPHGSIWYNPKGQRCYCQSANKQPYYVCEPTTTTASG